MVHFKGRLLDGGAEVAITLEDLGEQQETSSNGVKYLAVVSKITCGGRFIRSAVDKELMGQIPQDDKAAFRAAEDAAAIEALGVDPGSLVIL